ncbi:MAG: hypothetical protein ABEL97_09225 [Salinibacter sp.]
MTRVYHVLLFLCVLILGVLPGCDGSGPAPSEVVKGPSVSIDGGGTAYAWVRLNGDDQPVAVGASLSKAAYGALTDTSHVHSGSRSADGRPTTRGGGPTSFNLPIPDEAPPPYDHVTMLWNPEGHPPGPYTVPHLGMHFFFVSPATQKAIKGGPVQTYPASKYLPDGYAPLSPNVPRLGVNYADTTASEFRGQPFTHTIIYGFHKGKSTFINPMVAADFLSDQPDVTTQLPQPEAYEKAGLYPTRYRVTFDTETSEYRFVLDDLVRRSGS